MCVKEWKDGWVFLVVVYVRCFVCVGAVIKLCVRIPMLVVYMCASKR